jgi:multiple sugar transport system substrate-binding protein
VIKGNNFEMDKKVKIDFAANSVNFDIMPNHTSFYSQYENALEPLNDLFTADDLKDFTPFILKASKKDGKLLMIPRLADISLYYYKTDLFNDEANKSKFKTEYKYDLAPPQTLDQFKDIAMFFVKQGNGKVFITSFIRTIVFMMLTVNLELLFGLLIALLLSKP